MQRAVFALVITLLAGSVLWLLFLGMSEFFFSGLSEPDPSPLLYKTSLDTKPDSTSSCDTLSQSIVELVTAYKYCAVNDGCSLDQPGCEISCLEGPTKTRFDDLKRLSSEYEAHCGTCPHDCGPEHTQDYALCLDSRCLLSLEIQGVLRNDVPD